MSSNSQHVVLVKNGLEWEQENIVFNCLDGAIRYADNHFPHNNWRIVDRHTGEVKVNQSSLGNLREDASQSLRRFEQVRVTREYYDTLRIQREGRQSREPVLHNYQDAWFAPQGLNRVQNGIQRVAYILRNLQPEIEIEDEDDPISEVCWWKEGF